MNPFPYCETTPFERRNNQRVDDQVVDFRKSRMWEKSRGIPLGPERVEAKPLENRSECSRDLSPSLFFYHDVFLKGLNPPIKYRVSRYRKLSLGPHDFA